MYTFIIQLIYIHTYMYVGVESEMVFVCRLWMCACTCVWYLPLSEYPCMPE